MASEEKAPSPLPSVLPAGTRSTCGAMATTELKLELESNLFERRRELEAARALAGERKQELSYAHQEKLGLEGELEAARARVGALETTIRGVLDEWRTGHSMHWDREGTHGANCPACKLDGDARHCLRKALEPTPSAPTPAVVEKPRQLVRHWCRSCDDVVTVHEGGCCSRCGSYETERQTKESPPRDSGGETPVAIAWNTKGPVYDEQRKDPLQAKEAMVASVPAAAPSVPGVLRPPVHGAGEVAAPGLTPEEAEEGARRMYEIIRARFGLADWATMHADAKELVFAAYRFAQSAGAQSAKAKGAAYEAFFREHGEELFMAIGSVPLSHPKYTEIQRAGAALAELEKPK